MKILHVIASVNPEDGGPIEGVRQIAAELMASGHTVEIVSMDAPDADFLQSYPLTVHALGPSWMGYAYTGRAVPWLQAHAYHYDAVIVNGLWQYSSFAAWRALAGGPVPYFVFTHGMLDPWFKRTYRLKHLKKWLYWPWGEYRVLRDARGVIFTCEEERRLARKSFWLYRCREIVSAYGTSHPPANRVELTAQFFHTYPLLHDKRLVLFLGRIHEKKGCDLLIDAFAKVAHRDPRLHLVMAGPDQTGWAAILQERARQSGIADRITWPGMLSGNTKWGAFYASEVFALPSHQENFGIAVAEALACGKSVLISDKVNIWREIAEDQAGWVATDTLAGTIENFERWLNESAEEMTKKSAAARTCFEKRFDIRMVATQLLAIVKGKASDFAQ